MTLNALDEDILSELLKEARASIRFSHLPRRKGRIWKSLLKVFISCMRNLWKHLVEKTLA